ncbi:MAG: heavy-metal-associated domain-containing protein [Planctomycetes bacterium]|nr:heavy-metal-associated domain-containing protein [Planctomycetota bacterium]
MHLARTPWIAAALSLYLAATAASRAVGDDRPSTAPESVEPVYVDVTEVVGAETKTVLDATRSVYGVREADWIVVGSELRAVRVVGKAPDQVLVETARRAGAATATIAPVVTKTFVFEKKLHCAGCIATVSRAVRAVAGVKSSTVSSDLATVSVTYDSRRAKASDIEAALAAAGKPAKVGDR